MVDRFEFILCDSKKVKPQLLNKYFDLAFVDGDHGHEGVINDVNLCLDLNIPYLVFDDWHHKEEDQNAVEETAEEIYKNKLTRLKLYDLEGMKVKVALYRNDTVNTKNFSSDKFQKYLRQAEKSNQWSNWGWAVGEAVLERRARDMFEVEGV